MSFLPSVLSSRAPMPLLWRKRLVRISFLWMNITSAWLMWVALLCFLGSCLIVVSSFVIPGFGTKHPRVPLGFSKNSNIGHMFAWGSWINWLGRSSSRSVFPVRMRYKTPETGGGWPRKNHLPALFKKAQTFGPELASICESLILP